MNCFFGHATYPRHSKISPERILLNFVQEFVVLNWPKTLASGRTESSHFFPPADGGLSPPPRLQHPRGVCRPGGPRLQHRCATLRSDFHCSWSILQTNPQFTHLRFKSLRYFPHPTCFRFQYKSTFNNPKQIFFCFVNEVGIF